MPRQPGTAVGEVVERAFEIGWDDAREANALSAADAENLLIALREERPEPGPQCLPHRGRKVAEDRTRSPQRQLISTMPASHAS
jgi:hypothetical protein